MEDSTTLCDPDNGKRVTVEPLVPFDIRDTDGRTRTAIYRALHGREETVKGRTYVYPGLIHEGAVRVGQSVFALDPDQAERLLSLLRRHHVPCWHWETFWRSWGSPLETSDSKNPQSTANAWGCTLLW